MRLKELQVDTHVVGIEPSGAVKLLYMKKAGEDAADVTYELLDGRVLKKTLFRADEAKLSVASETRTWPFDAKPESLNLMRRSPIRELMPGALDHRNKAQRAGLRDGESK